MESRFDHSRLADPPNRMIRSVLTGLPLQSRDSTRFDIPDWWLAEEALVFAAEVACAFISKLECGARGLARVVSPDRVAECWGGEAGSNRHLRVGALGALPSCAIPAS